MRVIVPILLVLAVSSLLLAATQEESIFPFSYEKMQLENGFKVYLIKTPSPGQIAYITIVRTGSRDEWEPGKSGYAHLSEHLMFRGTEKYPGPVYDHMLTSIGADHNAFTSDDVTAYYVVFASNELETVVNLESDRFMNLHYEEPEFRKETGAVLGEYYQGLANPRSLLYENLRSVAFTKHTYHHTTIGFGDDVKAMPEAMAYSVSFHERYYRPENCVLVVAGDVDYEKAKELITKYYSPWKPGYVPPKIQPEPAQTAPREVTVTFKGRTLPMLTVAYKSPAWNAGNRVDVACDILGRIAYGQNSEIYKKLVVKEQKVQVLFANFSLARDPYLLTISTMVNNPADVDAVQAEIEATAAKFRETPVDAKLLEETKERMKYEFLMGLETPQGVIFSLLDTIVNSGTLESVDEYYKTVAAVTVEDVQAAAQKYLVDSGKTVAKLFPEEGGQ
jgi:zinc protease